MPSPTTAVAALALLLSSLSSPHQPTTATATPFSEAWAALQRDFVPPTDKLLSEPITAPPHPLPRDAARNLHLPPPRPVQMARLYKPWGDGFVRMPVQRTVFNDTRHRRAGRLRRPNRPTYPASGGAVAGGTPVNSSSGRPGGATGGVADEEDWVIERRDVAGGAPQAAAGGTPAAPAEPGTPGVESLQAQGQTPSWGYSRLDDYEGLAYMIGLEIGTPPQRVAVSIDTGSYELWVNPRCIGSPDPIVCGTYGHYYPQLSSTASSMGGNFRVVYGTGEAQGTYYSDSIKVAMFQVPSVQFAVASDTNYTYSGVLGLGYTYPFTTKYPTLLSMMWALGFIAAPVFSMGLGGDGDGFSEIIFGGVNRWKFTGPLEPVEIWPPVDRQDPTWIQYWVNVTSIGMSPPSERPRSYTSSNFNMAMLIDSGSTLSYIREDIVQVVGKQLNATVDNGNYWVDCKLRNQNGTVDFGFNRGKMMITVRYKDFIWEQTRGKCLMGFQPADPGSTNFVLGDTFIRGAYLVFDQQSDVVWMADYYNCGDGVAMVGDKPADTQFVRGQC